MQDVGQGGDCACPLPVGEGRITCWSHKGPALRTNVFHPLVIKASQCEDERVTQPSQLYRLIEERLDGTLAEFVAERWPQKGWRKIAADVYEATGISVSYGALRAWFADRITVEVKVS